LSDVNFWGEDALSRLSPFMQSGKMIRGGLVCLGYELCGRKSSSAIFPAAAAVEFIQTALLIHDDIIDRDKFRRGQPSLYYQYAQRGKEEGVADPDHFGQGMAICLGDIGFFLAFELLSQLDVAKILKESIIRLWSQELCYVGLAQMQDLYFGEARSDITPQDIMKLYQYKTARYSFSLPLKTGGILGGADAKLMAGLEKCGNAFGLLFQVKDDELGLYGSEKDLGKPVGSDLKECKKTLHYYYLHQKADRKDVERFEMICGSEDLSLSMVDEVREMMKKYSVDEIIAQKMVRLQGELEEEIAALDIPEKYQDIFYDLLDFSLKRKK
jgi:geranylgeranyl diphosphate synthase type I